MSFASHSHTNSTSWERVLSRHFHKTHKRRYQAIIVYLSMVNMGLKPSYLWDIPIKITTQQMAALLNELRIEGLVRGDLHAVGIGSDVLVVCVCEVVTLLETSVSSELSQTRWMNGQHSNKFLFVDISNNLEKPMLVESDTLTFESIQHMVSMIKEQMLQTYDLKDSMLLSVKEHWCVPTLFGIFLGFPLVYWFSHTDCNSLSLELLSVFNVVATYSGKQYNVASFSLPSSLLCEALEAHIKLWYTQLNKICSRQTLFTDLKLDRSVQSASTVIL